MRKIFSVLAFIGLSSYAFAQMPGGMPGNGKMQAPSIGHIYGKIVDSADKPISDVSVFLMQSKYDSASKKAKYVLLKGLITKAGGEFSFEELPIMAKLKLKNDLS